MSRLMIVAILLSLSFEAVAQSSGSLSSSLSDSIPATSQGASEFILHNSDYVEHNQPYFREGARSDNFSIALDHQQTYDFSKKFKAHLNLKDEYSTAENWNYINAREAYTRYRLNSWNTVSIGRKLETWSNWEADWNQGVFQPRYMQDKLRPDFAGLTGVFYSTRTESTGFTLAVLPAHIPDLGAHVWIKDNHFYSQNPWFFVPASHFSFHQGDGDIHYSLVQPDAGKVLAHPGVATKFEYQDDVYGTRVSLAYKPIPTFLLGFPSRQKLVLDDNTQYMQLDITPRIVYAGTVNWDNSFHFSGWTWNGSLTYEQPDHDMGPVGYTSEEVQRAFIWTASLDHALEEEGPHAAHVKVGVFKLNGGNAKDGGDFANPSFTKFEPRYQYNEAYMLSLRKPWRGLFQYPLETEAKLIYDRLQNAGVVSLSAGLNLAKDLRADLQMDWIGVVGQSAEVEDSFLWLYRANDRFGMGMTYVF